MIDVVHLNINGWNSDHPGANVTPSQLSNNHVVARSEEELSELSGTPA